MSGPCSGSVWGSGFGVRVSGFKVQGSGSRVQGSGSRVQGSRVQGPGSRVQGPGSRVQGPGSRVQGPWPDVMHAQPRRLCLRRGDARGYAHFTNSRPKTEPTQTEPSRSEHRKDMNIYPLVQTSRIDGQTIGIRGCHKVNPRSENHRFGLTGWWRQGHKGKRRSQTQLRRGGIHGGHESDSTNGMFLYRQRSFRRHWQSGQTIR